MGRKAALQKLGQCIDGNLSGTISEPHEIQSTLGKYFSNTLLFKLNSALKGLQKCIDSQILSFVLLVCIPYVY